MKTPNDRLKLNIIINFIVIFILVAIIALIIYILLLIASEVNAKIEVLEILPNGKSKYYDKPIKVYEYKVPDVALQIRNIKSFIINTRGIPRNGEVLVANGPYGLGKATENAYTKASDYLISLNVFEKLGKVEIRIPDNEIICEQDGDYRWRVKWHELTIDTLNNSVLRDCYWQGVFYTKVKEPKNVSEKLYNPIGFYITDYDIDLLKEQKIK